MSAAIPRGLSAVPLPAIALLLEAVERGRVECPLSEAGLLSAGFGPAARPILEATGGLGAEAVTAALRLVAAERVHRPPPHLQPLLQKNQPGLRKLRQRNLSMACALPGKRKQEQDDR